MKYSFNFRQVLFTSVVALAIGYVLGWCSREVEDPEEPLEVEERAVPAENEPETALPRQKETVA